MTPENIEVTVIFGATTLLALEDLQRRFPDEARDALINHAVQVFWARTCSLAPGRELHESQNQGVGRPAPHLDSPGNPGPGRHDQLHSVT